MLPNMDGTAEFGWGLFFFFFLDSRATSSLVLRRMGSGRLPLGVIRSRGLSPL